MRGLSLLLLGLRSLCVLQLVVLIVGEGEVTSGVILNRPSIATVGDLFDRSKVLILLGQIFSPVTGQTLKAVNFFCHLLW